MTMGTVRPHTRLPTLLTPPPPGAGKREHGRFSCQAARLEAKYDD
jgi:hypothetical protein